MLTHWTVDAYYLCDKASWKNRAAHCIFVCLSRVPFFILTSKSHFQLFVFQYLFPKRGQQKAFMSL